MGITKQIVVTQLAESIQNSEWLLEFGKPIGEKEFALVLGNGPRYAADRAERCLGWIWRQWLLGNSRVAIQQQVGPFVKKGIEIRARSKVYDFMPLHDLFLINCAILGGTEGQIEEVAEVIADISGDRGQTPFNNGELYAAAWCGALKHWILGDATKALEQSELIGGAYRDQRLKAASKPLLTPWLKKDWPKFYKQQEKDFERLWASARKNHWPLRSENSTELIMTTDGFQFGHMWCWSHCGLALLAKREGADVVTDPFWFPPIALLDGKPVRPPKDPNQLNMF